MMNILSKPAVFSPIQNILASNSLQNVLATLEKNVHHILGEGAP